MNHWKYVLTMVAVTALAGCQTSGGVAPTDSVFRAQAEYCATADPFLREAMLAVIRAQTPDYPERGLCTDAEQALADELADRVASGDLDVEQAVEEQRRARERLDQAQGD